MKTLKQKNIIVTITIFLCFSFIVSAAASTTEQENALHSAQKYLSILAFSKKGLEKQLMFEGFTNEEAQYGVDNCSADWYEQAMKKAKSYLKNQSFSKKGLEKQLLFEGFTGEEAQYGVDNCNADWYEQAVKKSQSYLKNQSFSKKGLEEQLRTVLSRGKITLRQKNCNSDPCQNCRYSGV